MGRIWIERRQGTDGGSKRLYVIAEKNGERWHEGVFENQDLVEACQFAEGLSETYGMECTKLIFNKG